MAQDVGGPFAHHPGEQAVHGGRQCCTVLDPDAQTRILQGRAGGGQLVVQAGVPVADGGVGQPLPRGRQHGRGLDEVIDQVRADPGQERGEAEDEGILEVPGGDSGGDGPADGQRADEAHGTVSSDAHGHTDGQEG